MQANPKEILQKHVKNIVYIIPYIEFTHLRLLKFSFCDRFLEQDSLLNIVHIIVLITFAYSNIPLISFYVMKNTLA